MFAPLARCLTTAGVLLVTAGPPSTLSAQYQLPTLVSSVTADSLHEAAAALVADRRYRDAARLHRRAADLRAADDPLGFRDLTYAAVVVYAAGDRTSARRDMARAAGHALARGDLKSAALAYLDAAWIAQEQKNRKQVWEWGHRAEMLAASPLLGSADRAVILRRIRRAPVAMRIAMREQP